MQNACEMTKNKPSYMIEKTTLNDHKTVTWKKRYGISFILYKKYELQEKTHFENIFSINSSKYESKLHHLIFIQNRQVLPLPLIAHCGQLNGQFSKPQVLGKTTLHALSFDPRKFQFLAKISIFG